jgi:hypothetical protein
MIGYTLAEIRRLLSKISPHRALGPEQFSDGALDFRHAELMAGRLTGRPVSMSSALPCACHARPGLTKTLPSRTNLLPGPDRVVSQPAAHDGWRRRGNDADLLMAIGMVSGLVARSPAAGRRATADRALGAAASGPAGTGHRGMRTGGPRVIC